jgi:dTDP-4-amino-4,6-dideoxygalactose transaminase
MNLDKTPIPFLDLISSHCELEEELLEVCRTALRSAAFIGGPMVEGFESDFAQFCGTTYCIGVANGTDALRFALIAAGIQLGEIVLTVPNTFIATTEAISQAGGVPDFIDVDEHTCNMDPVKLREYLDTSCNVNKWNGRLTHKRTGRPIAAIVPVHLYGQPAHMDAIQELAEKYGLTVLEDACQAHGAEYYSERTKSWKKAGSMGIAAAFSFYPGKNLGACGEAGAVTTDNPQIAAKIRMLRDHGQSKRYFHEMEGYNGRLDAIMAGILKVKLPRLLDWNAQRRECARRYKDLLGDIEGITLPTEAPFAKSVYHLYVIRTEQRDEIQEYLSENHIGTGLHYPRPLHLQEAYKHMGYSHGSFPSAERISRTLLSLPMYPGLTEEQQIRVAESIKMAMKNLSTVSPLR